MQLKELLLVNRLRRCWAAEDMKLHTLQLEICCTDSTVEWSDNLL